MSSTAPPIATHLQSSKSRNKIGIASMAGWNASAADPDRKANAQEINACLQGSKQVGGPAMDTETPSAAEHTGPLAPQTNLARGPGALISSVDMDCSEDTQDAVACKMPQYPSSASDQDELVPLAMCNATALPRKLHSASTGGGPARHGLSWAGLPGSRSGQHPVPSPGPAFSYPCIAP